MLEEKDYEMIKAMIKYGGSFIKGLAEALLHADAANYHILAEGFPDYFIEYKTMAQRERAARKE